MENSKKLSKKENFYSTILNHLDQSTNLTELQKKLNISKQNLNYYIRQLHNQGIISRKGRGWWEVSKNSKNSTQYGNNLQKDSIRGHAYVWKVKIPKKIENWDKRVEILQKSQINFNLVGILKNIPRIKIMGRKIWLCDNHLRIFDKKGSSYYGKNAIESRKSALIEILTIIGAVEGKLGINLKPYNFFWAKEHYALIKNDLAIDHNRKGIILRISDPIIGEWLLIDDSMGEGGELENVGKNAFETNIPMQKWWNENKDTGFKVTPNFILEGFNKTNQSINSLLSLQQNLPNVLNKLEQQIESHLKLIQEYRQENVNWREQTKKKYKEQASQTKIDNFL